MSRLVARRQTVPVVRRVAIQGLLALLVVACGGEVWAGPANYTWDGGGADGNWQTANNWVANSTPPTGNNTIFVFGGSTRTSATNNYAAATTFRGIIFDPGAATFTLSGSSITLNNTNGILNNSSNTQNVNLAGIILSSNNTVFDSGSAVLNVSSPISGAFSISANSGNPQGSGTLTFSGSNSFSGLTVGGGVMRATTSANALGAGTLTLNGGNLELANDTGLNFGRNTTVSTSGTIFSERLTSGAGVTHTLGTLSIGAQTLTLDKDATVTSGTAGLTFGAVTLSAGGATFNANAGTLLTLGGFTGNTFGFTVGGAGDTNITGIIGTTTGTLSKTGSGKLTLTGANTYTGLTTITGGTLALGTGGSLANTAPVTVNGASATFDIGSISDSIGAVTLTDGSIIGTTGTLTGASYAVSNGSISAILGGAVNLTKSTSGTVTLSGQNVYSGTTGVTAGVLALSSTGALGATSGVTVSATAALQLVGSGTITGRPLTLSGSGVSNDGALRNVSGTNGYTGNITLSTASRINSDLGLLTLSGSVASSNLGLIVGGAGDTTLSGTLSIGSGSLTKDGAGTLTLTAANTYTGTTGITAGVLNVQNATALGTSSAVTVASGAELQLQNGITISRPLTLTGTGVSGSGALRSISGANTYSGTITTAISAVGIGVDSGTLTLSGSLGGSNQLIKYGSGLLVLTGTDGISGAHTINSGTFQIGSTGVLSPGGGVVMNVNNATFDLNGRNATIGANGNATSSMTGGLISTASGTLSLYSTGTFTTLTTNSSANSSTISGNLSLGGTSAVFSVADGAAADDLVVSAVMSNGGLIKTGAGLMKLTGTNTYSGATAVQNGTLALGISNAIPSNSIVTLGNAAGAGHLTTGTFTNAIGGLLFSGSGGTVAIAANQTASPQITTTGTINLTGTSSLDLTGMQTSAAVYKLLSGSTLSGTFGTVTGLDSNYLLRYGTLTANELDAQRKANQDPTFAMTTGTVTRALVNTSVSVSGTVTNSSPVNSTALTLGLASTGLAGSGFTAGSVTAGSGLAVSGTLNAGATAGTQAWSITNTDTSAITTISSATGSLQVVNQRSFTVTSSTVALGRYLITSTLPSGTTGVTSTGSNATTATASLGSFSSSNGYSLGLTSGSANFAGAAASQTAGYTVSGTATSAGLLSGSFSSSVTAEFGNINPVVVNYTANPVNQRSFSPSTSTLALGYVHQGGAFSTPTLTVTSNGLNATTASGTLGSFTGGAAGFSLGLTSGSAAFLGASGTQTATYTLTGSTASLGAISGTFSSTVAGEFAGIPTVTVAVTGNVYSGQATWATNGGGNWGTIASGFGTNWGANQGSPGLDAAFANTDTATFGSALTGSGTAAINTNGANISLKSLTFNNAAGSYEIYQTGGSGSLTLLAAGTNSAAITVERGSHAIHADVTLGSNTIVDVGGGASLTFHNALAGSAAYGLTKTGAGKLYFDGNSTYAGNTAIEQGFVGLISGVTPLGTGTISISKGATLDLNFLQITNPVIVGTGGILLNSGTAQAVIVTGSSSLITGTASGNIDVVSGGNATFASTVNANVSVSAGGVVTFAEGVTGSPTVGVASGGKLSVVGTAAGSYTVAGTGTFGGPLTGSLAVSSGGVVAFNGSNSGGSSFNVGSGGIVNVGSGASIGGQLHVSGSAVIAGSVASNADVIVQNGGLVKLVDGASFGQTALTNAGNFVVDGTTAFSIATAIGGSGSLQKLGDGVLTLTGNSTFTGPTSLDAGKLVVNGSLASSVAAAVGTTLGGSGSIDGTLSGSGLVSPGNSPGILTAGQFDPSSGLDVAFEVTATTPNYANASGSLNDVLRLTGSSPFVADLNSGNVIDVYLNVDTFTPWTAYEAGFFTTLSAADLLKAVEKATYHFWAKTTNAGQNFNGTNYVDLATIPGITNAFVTTVSRTANFGTGPVSGSVTQFVIVPEPDAVALAVLGVAAVAGSARLRRRFVNRG